MDELVRWLGEQLDDDERIARAACGSTVVGEVGNWKPAPGGDEWEAFAGDVEEELLVALRPGLPRPPDVMSGMWGAWVSNEPDFSDRDAGSAMPVLRHAAEHDPARVLREIDAKRRLIDVVLAYEAKIDGEWGCCHDKDEIASGLCSETQPKGITALRLLATVYRERPGYRAEEWAP